MLKTGVLLERAMRRKCSWNTWCVKMLSDVVIEKCSWHQKIFIGTILGQCTVHSPLEKHKTLPKRLPSVFMPAAKILGSLNCPECDLSLLYCVWIAGKFKNVFITKWKKSACGSTEYSDSTDEGDA